MKSEHPRDPEIRAASPDGAAWIDTIANAWRPPAPSPGERRVFRERVIEHATRSPWRSLAVPTRGAALLLAMAVGLLLFMRIAPEPDVDANVQAAPIIASGHASGWERDLFDPPELDEWSSGVLADEGDMLPADYAAIESAFL